MLHYASRLRGQDRFTRGGLHIALDLATRFQKMALPLLYGPLHRRQRRRGDHCLAHAADGGPKVVAKAIKTITKHL